MGVCSSIGPNSANETFKDAAEVKNSQILLERKLYAEKHRALDGINGGLDNSYMNPHYAQNGYHSGDDEMSTSRSYRKNQINPGDGNHHPTGNLPPLNMQDKKKRSPPPRVYEDQELYELYPDIANTVLQDFKDVTRELKANQDQDSFEYLYDQLNNKVWIPYRDCDHKDQQRLMAYHMAKIGFAKAVTSYYQYVLDYDNKAVFTGKNFNKSITSQLLGIMRQIIDRFCNSNKKLGKKVGEAGFLEFMVRDLNILKKKIKNSVDDMTCFAILSALGVVYSCSKAESNAVIYKDLDIVSCVEPFVQATDSEVKAVSLVVLASIVDEEVSPSVVKDESLFEVLINSLDRAWEESTKQYKGYSTVDITTGITQLAVTDPVKQIVYDQGVMRPLMRMLEQGDHEERHAASLAVWTLAFSKDNKQKLQDSNRLLSLLDDVRDDEHSTEEGMKAATGALWMLRDQELYFTTKGARERFRKQEKERPHVMISYNATELRKPMKIRDRLFEAGYNVWIDLDHDHEEMLNARIDAVENAAVVLAFMSHKYKQAQNNRTEADYAHDLGKPVLPLLVQGNYKPDGWLRKMLGRSYIDFSKNARFEKAFAELLDQLGDHGKMKY